MERVYRTKTFTRWMRKAGLTDDALCRAVSEMIAGLVDADLGGNLVKKRVSVSGRGKRGGVRTIVATQRRGRWFFLFGFSKSEKDSVGTDELKALQLYAADLLGLSEKQLEFAMSCGEVVEICDGKSEKQNPG